MRYQYIGILFNKGKQPSRETAHKVAAFLKGKNIKNYFLSGSALSRIKKGTDLIISVGGDGTVLKATRSAMHKQVPVLGINAGNLGFLTSIDSAGFEEPLMKVLQHGGLRSRRGLLSVNLYKKDKLVKKNMVCFNDCVIKAGGMRAGSIELYYDGKAVKTYFGDGVIVSTPSGSTAYSLAAGGPVIVPGLSVLVLTPISPHSLSQRPLVFPPGKIILKPKLRRVPERMLLSLDGQLSFIIGNTYTVEITLGREFVDLIFQPDYSFFGNMNKKFKWSER